MGLDKVVWEHYCFYPVQIQSFFKHGKLMGGEAYVANFSGGLGFKQSLQRTAGACNGINILWLHKVELIKVYIVSAEVFQADVYIGSHGIPGTGLAFGGQHELIPYAFQTGTDVFFTYGVAAGCVDIIDAIFRQLMNESNGFIPGNALYGDATKAQTGDLETGIAEGSVFHQIPPCDIYDIVILLRPSPCIHLSTRGKGRQYAAHHR